MDYSPDHSPGLPRYEGLLVLVGAFGFSDQEVVQPRGLVDKKVIGERGFSNCHLIVLRIFTVIILRFCELPRRNFL